MTVQLERELLEALRPVLLPRVQDGADAARVLREVVGAALFAASRTGALGVPLPPGLPPSAPEPVVYDLRDAFNWKHPKCKKGRDGRAVRRDRREITGVMLHQMAVTFGREGEDFAERAARTAYHIVVSDDGGEVAILKPLDVYAHHGNRANAETIGVGVEGTYPGLARGRQRKHTLVTPGLQLGIRRALELATEELPKVSALLAHRQSSDDRRGDPGEELWSIGVEAATVLGLHVLPAWTIGDGRPLPAEWPGGLAGVRY